MIDLSTLGGTGSAAFGVSDDGAVVVGQSDTHINGGPIPNETHAFRWTTKSGMIDLGTLGGGWSQSWGISNNGAVVVGAAGTTSGGGHAFRWTATTGMVDIDTTGREASVANATNQDGSVIVGFAQFPSADYHAFRWTSATGMVDLGILGGGYGSQAYDVSADGSVVVGNGSISNGPAHAIRWTAATGLQDLNALLTSAGVKMTGITLTYANGVSSNGIFIVGQAIFPSGDNRGFLVRYDDTAQKKVSVIAGLTSLESVQGSIDDLGAARQLAMIEQLAISNPADQSTAFAQNANFAGGLEFRANAAFVSDDHQFAREEERIRANVELRYLSADGAQFRPIIDMGGWTEPNATFSFQRKYMNGAGFAQGQGRAIGSISSVYARAGMVWEPAPTDQVMMTGEIDRDWSSVGAYAELPSAANPFEAEVSAGTDTMNVIKARVDWLYRFGSRIGGSLWAAVAQSFDNVIMLTAAVPGSGDLVPIGLRNNTWAEYGCRTDLKFNPRIDADLLVGGVTGMGGIGSSAFLRAAAHLKF
jgi:probable HAF family extracellular repeat protein